MKSKLWRKPFCKDVRIDNLAKDMGYDSGESLEREIGKRIATNVRHRVTFAPNSTGCMALFIDGEEI